MRPLSPPTPEVVLVLHYSIEEEWRGRRRKVEFEITALRHKAGTKQLCQEVRFKEAWPRGLRDGRELRWLGQMHLRNLAKCPAESRGDLIFAYGGCEDP